MKTLILFILLVTLSLGMKAQIVDDRTGVEIKLVVNNNTFPDSWTISPINGKGVSLDTSEYKRSILVIRKALKKYPAEVISKNLKTIYILKTINFYGENYGGTNSNDVVYIANNGTAMGYSDYYIEKTFHHEFSSVLFNKFMIRFNKKGWKENNKIEYGAGGVEALKSGEVDQNIDSLLNQKGFLFEYAFSSIENDFNSFGENIFIPSADFWQTVESYPGLSNKLDIIIDFYYKLDNTFTKQYFKSFNKQ